MSIHLLVTFTAKPDKVSAFSEILEQVKFDLPKKDGCQGVRILHKVGNHREFTLLETWKSEDFHKRHIEEVIESGGWEFILSHLTSEPVSSYYNEI